MDIVVFPFHDWVKLESQEWVRRDTQIVRELARRPQVRRLLVVNRPSSLASAARAILRGETWRTRGGEPVASGRGWWLRRLDERLFVLDIHIPDVVQTLRARRAWWERALWEPRTRGAILAAYGELDLGQPVIWCFTPIAAPLAATLPRDTFVFDAIDDWLEHPEMAPYRAAARRGYEVVCREADLITCVAEDLRARFAGARGDVRWVPNGISGEFFRRDVEVPAELAAIPRPRAGYLGYVERRVDVDLLVRAASELSFAHFCFVGPYDQTHVQPLLGRGNCHFFGQRKHSLMPGYIAGFDVCMIPHVVNRFTMRMDPLKLYEYMAQGKEIVTTPVAGVERFGDQLRVAASSDSFTNELRKALNCGNPTSEARQNAVRAHTWESRVDELLSLVMAVARQGKAK